MPTSSLDTTSGSIARVSRCLCPLTVTFSFQPNQKVPKSQCEDNRAWVQGIVERVTGQKLPVNIVFTDASGAAPAQPAPATQAAAPAPVSGERKSAALEHETVRHLLEVFPVEKTTVQEE